MTEAKLKSLLSSMGGKLLGDDTLTERKRVPSTSSNTASESSSVVITKNKPLPSQAAVDTPEPTQDQHLRIRTKNLEVDEEDDFNDYVIESPLPPPKELHPGKLYALYEFTGDDPSHCELDRDDAVVLLNDQDNYWWLVRKEMDGKIGFAPAECLETYQERLARLNCWKNEELERNSKENLEKFEEKTQSDSKINKSVAFSSEITVTEPKEIEHSDEEEYTYDTSTNTENDDITHYYNDGQQRPRKAPTDDHEEDEAEEDEDEESSHDYEANSDVLSDNYPVTPLILKKKSKPAVREAFGIVESDFEESPLIQPSAFFVNNNTSGSIGTYSPSSSEFDSPENTPPLDQYKRKPPSAYDGFRGISADLDNEENKGNIPQSKGTRDIANSMKMLDDLINDELNTTATLDDEDDDDTEEGEKDGTLTFEDDEHQEGGLLQSPIILEEPHRTNLSNITNSTYTNSNTSLQLTSTATSVDQFEDRDHTEKLHPEIVSMFQDSLSKMDELQEKIRLLNSKFA